MRIRADERQARGDAIRRRSDPVEEVHRGRRYSWTLANLCPAEHGTGSPGRIPAVDLARRLTTETNRERDALASGSLSLARIAIVARQECA